MFVCSQATLRSLTALALFGLLLYQPLPLKSQVVPTTQAQVHAPPFQQSAAATDDTFLPAHIRAQAQANRPKAAGSPEAQHEAALVALERTGNRGEAVMKWRQLTETWPASPLAVEARLRMAEHGAGYDFKNALRLLQEVSQSRGLAPDQRSRAQFLTGIYHYQLARTAEAATALRTLLTQNSVPEQITTTARKYLAAIEDPSSTSALHCIYERGFRWNEAGGVRDLSWREWHRLRTLAQQPHIQQYLNGSAVALEERAEMRHRLALAAFEIGNMHEAAEGAQAVLDLFAPRAPGEPNVYPPDPETSYTPKPAATTQSADAALPGEEPTGEHVYCTMPEQIRHPRVLNSPAGRKALYLLAFYSAHCAHMCHAVPLFRALIDNSPDGSGDLIPRAYEQLAFSHEYARDPLGAALTVEEFLLAYPDRVEATRMRELRSRLRIIYPREVTASAIDAGKAVIVAKLAKRRARIPGTDAPERPVPVAAPTPEAVTADVAGPRGGK